MPCQLKSNLDLSYRSSAAIGQAKQEFTSGMIDAKRNLFITCRFNPAFEKKSDELAIVNIRQHRMNVQ